MKLQAREVTNGLRFPEGPIVLPDSGDISIEREGFSFHCPLMTSLRVSVVLSLLAWWFWRK